MAKRLARKVKRTGKAATQFKFTSTFEYIDFDCVGTWKPENLRVIWLRSHRRVESTSVQFVTTEDRGPKGSSGRAVFDPALAVSLVVTLYRDAKSSEFDEKEYKYYLEHDGSGGRKILASFTCDMAEYVGMPSSKHALEMNFKCVSKKISKAVLGITLSCEFIKEGKATDDDMQSTFSAVDPANEELTFADEDEDDEDNLDEAATLNQNRRGPSDDSGPPAGNPFDDESEPQGGMTQHESETDPPPKPPRDTESDVEEELTSSQKREVASDEQQTDSFKLQDKAEASSSGAMLQETSADAAKTVQEMGGVVEEGVAVVDKLVERPIKSEPVEADVIVAENTGSGLTSTASTTTDSNTVVTDTAEATTDTESPPAGIDNTVEPISQSVPPTREVLDENMASPRESNDGRDGPPVVHKNSPKLGNQPPAHTTPTKAIPLELELSPSNGSPASKVESSGELASGSPRVSVKNSWLPDAEFVDCHDIATTCDRVDRADVIGLYFSAQWCPPCRRFLPKLIKFYNALRENDKNFEIIYVSNDNTRTEMIQYMQLEDHPMPWLAFPHSHKLIQKLKEDFKVSSIPLLVIVNHKGELLDSNAKKTVESASSASSAVKEYTKWLGLKDRSSSQSDDEVKQKKGIFKHLKNKLLSKDENDEPEPSPKQHEPPATITEDNENRPGKEEREMAESKVHVKQKSHTGNSKDELTKQLKQKDDIISHLEEVNMSLDQTNKDLNRDMQELKNKVSALEDELATLKESSAKREAEDERFRETLKLQGWLFKRGIKGPTASVWRRRYFRLDQGSKLAYYKTQAEGTPQGFIDLVKVVGVSEVSPAQQDKNNASFNISCEGRTYQLQAYDEATMRRWMSAIEYLKDFYQKQEGASP